LPEIGKRAEGNRKQGQKQEVSPSYSISLEDLSLPRCAEPINGW
jgi:hypothetical protein